jgi:hypothetical protein
LKETAWARWLEPQEHAGCYEFLLDLRDPDRPAVTIKPVDPGSSRELT